MGSIPLNYNDARWKKLRQQAIDRDLGKCTMCEHKESLEVHHTYYVPGRQTWEYPLFSLVTYCKSCHQKYGHTPTSKLPPNEEFGFHEWEEAVSWIENGNPENSPLWDLCAEFAQAKDAGIDKKTIYRAIRSLWE